MATVKASIYLDTRRAKNDGTYPVKLRVYSSELKQAQFYPIGEDLSLETFDRSYGAIKPRGEYRDLHLKLKGLEKKASDIAAEVDPFTFERFQKKMFRTTSAAVDVFSHYRAYIDKLNEFDQLSTASSYHLSCKSFEAFVNRHGGKPITRLHFANVTPDFLNHYERWMLERGKGITTVGIYARCLRTIFNNAIAEGDTQPEQYPFGKRGYQIPKSQNIKKALSREDLHRLFTFTVGNEHQAKARDFWFFSFQCNGINMKDIAELRYRDIEGDKIMFVRSKTRNTSKSNTKPIIAYRTAFINDVIARHGNTDNAPDNYVFNVLTHGLAEVDKRKAVQNFTRLVNQHIKRLATAAGIESDISTYWARHSFTTTAIRNGASMEHIQESLGHKHMSTTQNYWAGFEDTAKREIANRLMDFALNVATV